jgi:formamidopyrimidine-DNA glycosylase
MPEAAEVRITAIFLYNELMNKTIMSMHVRDGPLKKRYDLLPEKAMVTAVTSKGKWIYITTDKGCVRIHLNMTGQWRLTENNNCRAYLQLEDKRLFMNDGRGWSRFIVCSEQEMKVHMDSLGPNVLDNLTFQEFTAKIRKTKKRMDVAVMDQELIAGIGNYMKSEILYRARINPTRKASSLNEDEWYFFYEASLAVANEAFESNGVSIRDYAGGDYQSRLRVYGRQGKQCERGHIIEIYESPNKRTTFWCSECQM